MALVKSINGNYLTLDKSANDNAIDGSVLSSNSVPDSKLNADGILSLVESLVDSFDGGGGINATVRTNYKMGYVHGQDYSNPHESSNTVYSRLIERKHDTINVDVVSGYKALLVYYDASGSYIAAGTWLTGNNAVDVSTREAFCVEVRRSDDSAITIAEAQNAADIYTTLNYTDSTLSIFGMAADALVTGNIASDLASLTGALSSGNDMSQILYCEYRMGYVHTKDYDNPNISTNTTYSKLFVKEHNTLHVDIDNEYKALVVYYTAAGVYISSTTWLTGNNTIDISAKEAFCIEIRKQDDSSITVAEAENAANISYSFSVFSGSRRVINLSADSTEMLTITESCDINGNGHTIEVSNDSNFALYISGNIVVNVYNLTLKGGMYSAARVTYGATVNFYNCEFAESDMGMSTAVLANTNCWDCFAHDNDTDGFNYHGAGKNTAYNCYGIDNGDDGISNHDDCSLKIVGGKWIGNAKAGIAGPTYGAGDTEILDVYCANNVRYGLLIYSDAQTDEVVVVQNAIVVNSPVGARVSNYQCVFNNVKFANCPTETEVLGSGSITEY